MDEASWLERGRQIVRFDKPSKNHVFLSGNCGVDGEITGWICVFVEHEEIVDVNLRYSVDISWPYFCGSWSEVGKLRRNTDVFVVGNKGNY
jgi:hypothetical protein